MADIPTPGDIFCVRLYLFWRNSLILAADTLMVGPLRQSSVPEGGTLSEGGAATHRSNTRACDWGDLWRDDSEEQGTGQVDG